jgi:hypothetical protein
MSVKEVTLVMKAGIAILQARGLPFIQSEGCDLARQLCAVLLVKPSQRNEALDRVNDGARSS